MASKDCQSSLVLKIFVFIMKETTLDLEYNPNTEKLKGMEKFEH